MLAVNNIEVLYSEVVLAVRGVSLRVEPGQCVALLGANGAGKSTTLKAVSGLIQGDNGRVASGSIDFGGVSTLNKPPESLVREGLVHILEGRRLLRHMNVDQNLTVGGHRLRSRVEMLERKEEIYQMFPALDRLRARTSGYLSGGEQQMLVLGRALMSKPRLILIDEPSLGLSPQVTAQIFRLLAECKRLGTSMLVVEQNAPAVLSIADYGYVMENGRVVLQGTAYELTQNDDVREFYLGAELSGGRNPFRDVKHYRRRKRWLG